MSYRGNGASVLRIMPYAAIHYGAYEHYRSALLTAADRVGATQWLTSPATAHHAMRVSPIVDLLAGSGAGESAALLCVFWQGQAHVMVPLFQTYWQGQAQARALSVVLLLMWTVTAPLCCQTEPRVGVGLSPLDCCSVSDSFQVTAASTHSQVRAQSGQHQPQPHLQRGPGCSGLSDWLYSGDTFLVSSWLQEQVRCW